MFLQLLDDRQRKAFCRVALFMIRLDGVVDLREEVVLDEALREMHLAHGDLPACPAALEELLAELGPFAGEREATLAMLVETFRVVTADRVEDDAEAQAMEAIAERLGVDAGLLERCRDYSARLQELLEEGQALLAGGD